MMNDFAGMNLEINYVGIEKYFSVLLRMDAEENTGVRSGESGQDLFQFALEELEPAGWHLDQVTEDLHHKER